jgi:predicted regulator of Ras-like GTPase activity (Roadblock/LC7/MglB family)
MKSLKGASALALLIGSTGVAYAQANQTVSPSAPAGQPAPQTAPVDQTAAPAAQADSGERVVVTGSLISTAFSSTAALAQLLGESEFSVLFHEGVKESMHVSTVDEQTILLAIFDERTTIGMVRLFAREACASIRAVLEEARKRPKLVGVLAAPLTAEEARRASDHRPA